jgi:hypothetical protein
MNLRTLQDLPHRVVDGANAEASTDRLPILVLTGHRLDRKYMVLVLGIPVFLTFRQFEELLELVHSRLTSQTGFRAVPPDQTDYEFVRLQVHRLRRAIDTYTTPGTGRAIIQTGAGTEYRLAMIAKDIGIDLSFYDLPPDLASPELVALLREKCTKVKLVHNPFEIRAAGNSTYTQPQSRRNAHTPSCNDLG